MLKTELLPDGRTHTWSDAGMMLRQDTGALYEDAVDTVAHTYEETDIPIPAVELDAEEALEIIRGGEEDDES